MDCIARLGNGRAIGRARVNLFVIRAFIKMREQLATDAAILKRLAEIDKMLLVHDSALHDLYQNCCRCFPLHPSHPGAESVFTNRK